MMSWLGKMLLDWVLGFLSKLGINVWKRSDIKQDAKAQAEADLKKGSSVTPESSEKEVDDAIDEASRHM